MRIGVISDTHDHLEAIDAALGLMGDEGVDCLLHAGDFCSPFALKRVLQARMTLYAVFGNNDGERTGLAHLMPELSDGPKLLELGGRKVCLYHILENLTHEQKEASDIIVTGHTHEPRVERNEGRLFVNPGECCGWLSGRRTAALIDTDTMAADILEVPGRTRTPL